MGEKLSSLLSPLPLPVIDHTKHCTCTKCTDCICPICTMWKKVPYWKYLPDPGKYQDPYLLIQWFHSDLVLLHIAEVGQWWRGLLAEEPVAKIQAYLASLKKTRGKEELNFVGVHVRRTDYIQWVEKRYRGHPVDQNFFEHCMKEFRRKLGPDTLFLVTSDDIPWCR